MSSLSRRTALKVLGTTAAGAAVGAGAAGCSPSAPAAAAASTPPAGYGARAAFFTPHERATVDVLADYVIPRDDRSGSATDAGVPAWMDAFLSDADTDDTFRAQIRGGLAWLDAESIRRSGATFVRAADPQRRALLDAIAYPARARPADSHGVAFFSRFRDFVASGFFSSKAGYADLRYEGNVAVPAWTGCPDAANARLGVSQAVMATRVPVQDRAARPA